MSTGGHGCRGSVAGVRMILRYNWPLYVTGLATAALSAAVAMSTHIPLSIRTIAGTAALGAGWLAFASLVASWWIYDRSELYRWTWLTRMVPDAPRRVLVVHAGLDEATDPIREIWPAAHIESIDVHGGTGETTASLRRARGRFTPAPVSQGTVAAQFELVIAFLSAHEIRSAGARLELFHAIRRQLAPGGRLVVVEHCRDLANAIVYGPAVRHFYPIKMWRRIARLARLGTVQENKITPFITALVVEKEA